jgi:flagellar motor switch protein FliM
MSSPAGPAQIRSQIVERLIGASGATEHVVNAARSLAERALPVLLKELNASLSAPVEIEITDVEVGRQPDMVDIAGQSDAMTIVGSTNSGDALILLADSSAIALLVNMLFGGDGETAVPAINRELSAIELDVALFAFENVIQAVNGSGRRALGLRFPLARPVTGAELKKQILRDGPSVRMIYSIFTPAGSGRLIVAMPQRILLQFRGGSALSEADAGAEDWSARFGDEVIRSAVRVDATIPIGRMTLAEIARLTRGQLIEMPMRAQTDTRLVARDKTLFVGEFGKVGQHYTIRIRQPFDERQDLMDEILPS